MSAFKRFLLGATVFLLLPLCWGYAAQDQLSISDVIHWTEEMNKATIEQRDSVALPLALKILHLIPPQKQRDFTFPGDHDWDLRAQRGEALQTLKSLDALDEYLRKVKAYYKDDKNNLQYEWIMAEGLDLEDTNAAGPYWEQVHRLAPDELDPIQALSNYYGGRHDDAALMGLIDPPLEKGLLLPWPLSTDVVGLYVRQNKLDRLVQLFAADVARTHFTPNTYLVVSGDSLENKLRELNRTDDLIAIDRAWLQNDPNNNDRRGALTQLLQQKGDQADEGSQLLALVFPPDASPPAAHKRIRWTYDDIPDCELLDNIRRAKEAGVLSQLKAQAEANHRKNPDDPEAEQTLVFILAVGHDPEIRQLLPEYYKCIENAMALRPQGGPEGFSVAGIYAVFGELLKWPEAKDLLGPALDAALAAEQAAGNSDPFQHLATRALAAQDQPLAQKWLRRELDISSHITVYGLPPGPAPGRRSADDWVAISRLLIEANMPQEVDTAITALSDPTRSACADIPDSRSTKLAVVAKAAFDAGMVPQAQHGAECALKQLQADWRNPAQTGYYYSMMVTPLGIHLTAELLVRLGLSKDVQALRDLLNEWSTADSLDRKTLLADVDLMNQRWGDNPTGLTPGLWLDNSVGTKDGSALRVLWDLAAEGEGHLDSRDSGGNADSPARLNTQAITGFLSVDGMGLPKMDGKYSLQILAGSSGSDLRVIKTVNAAHSRGETDIELKPTDRVMRAIGQTSGDQPKLFLGPLVPISQGPNLMRPFVSARYFPADTANVPGEVPHTYEYAEKSSLPGGPAINGSFQTAKCPGNVARMELIGTRQKIVPETTYFQSGWVKSPGQWGVQYLDAKGSKIGESMASFQGQGDDWHLVQQAISIPKPEATAGSPVPAAAVEIEPVFTVSSGQSAQYQNLYFGVMDSPPPPEPPNPNRSDLMAGLQGATSIVEAPQGKILAAIFQNREVRCFDLLTHREIGIPGKLPGTPVDVGFLRHGTEVVAVDDQGNVMVRDVNGTMPGKVVYQVPWKIELMAVSDGSIIAVGNRNQNFASVIDLAAAKELSKVYLPSLPLWFMVMSPDGEKLYCDTPNFIPGIWNAINGAVLPLSVKPPMPDYPSTLPPFNSPWRFRPLNLPPLNLIAVARLFGIFPIVKTNAWQRPCWLDVQSGFYVLGLDSSLVYGMSPNAEVFYRVDTGPITAACLSTQSTDVYTVDTLGNLSTWKLPPDLKIPSFPTPPILQIGPPGNPGNSTSPTPAPAPSGLIVTATDHMRGFPDTTLSQPLDITVADNFGKLVKGAHITIESGDLHDVTFTSAGKSIALGQFSSTDFQTDQKGALKLAVGLGQSPQMGTLRVVATYNGLKSDHNVALEAIDDKAVLHQTHDISVTGSVGSMWVTWQDEPDNRTGFLIQRQVNNGPWRTIALMPADSTSFQDENVVYGANYYYNVLPSNEAVYGFPPKLPPPPDRLGDFVP